MQLERSELLNQNDDKGKNGAGRACLESEWAAAAVAHHSMPRGRFTSFVESKLEIREGGSSGNSMNFSEPCHVYHDIGDCKLGLARIRASANHRVAEP